MYTKKASGNYVVSAVHLNGGYHPAEAVFDTRGEAKDYVKKRAAVMQIFWCSPKYQIGHPFMIPKSLEANFKLRK